MRGEGGTPNKCLQDVCKMYLKEACTIAGGIVFKRKRGKKKKKGGQAEVVKMWQTGASGEEKQPREEPQRWKRAWHLRGAGGGKAWLGSRCLWGHSRGCGWKNLS